MASLASAQHALIQAANAVLQLTLADRGRSDDQCAVLNSSGDGSELFGAGKQRLGTNGGSSLAKSQLIRVHDPKMEEAEDSKPTNGVPEGGKTVGSGVVTKIIE